MIDEEWLKTVRGRTPDGFDIIGLLGVGTQKVVFEAKAPDGRSIAMQTPRWTLAYHIQEASLALTTEPRYSVSDLNEKICKLVGSRVVHRWIFWYHKLHVRYLRILQKNGIAGCIFSSDTPDSLEYIPFFLKSPGMIERLSELAEWPEPSASDPNSLLIYMHEDLVTEPLRDTVFSAHRWAAEAIEAIKRYPDNGVPYTPSGLYENPLIAWGGAILDDFFTDEEVEEAATFITERFGRLSERKDIFELQGQFFCIASMLAQYFEGKIDSHIQRWLRLAGLCGIYGSVLDRSGRTVATNLSVGA
jgi:hypothetical protein